MAGCYGNDPEDKYFENQLHKYLDDTPDDEDERAYWDELAWDARREEELLNGH
jgi:hypothetical protein